MKKVLFGFMAVLAIIGMVSCGGGGGTDPTPGGEYTVTFDKNTTDEGSTAPSPATKKVISPATTVGSLPTTEPTRPGYFFTGYNTKTDGTGSPFLATTTVTGNITVYAQWKMGYKVTFDKNDPSATDPNPTYVDLETTAIGESVTVGADKWPSDPTMAASAFLGWNTQSDGLGTEFTWDTPVTASITVFAKWKFNGGAPSVVGSTLVHPLPLLEVVDDTNGSTLNDDGSITMNAKDGGSRFAYAFPDEAYEADGITLKYEVFRVEFTVAHHAPSGNYQYTDAQVHINAYDGSPLAVGDRFATSNRSVPLGNEVGKGLIFETSYCKGGFQFQDYGPKTNAGVEVSTGGCTVKIASITFYNAPRYKVTFNSTDTDGGKYDAWAGTLQMNNPDYTVDGTEPEFINHPGVITDIWGSIPEANYPGYGVGKAKWPVTPDREDELPPLFFRGWYLNNELVSEAIVFDRDVTLVAKWTDTVPKGFIETITYANAGVSVPAYGFKIPDGTKLLQYDTDGTTPTGINYTGIKFKVKIGTDSGTRFRVFGPFLASRWTASMFPQTTSNAPEMNNGNQAAALTGGILTSGGIAGGVTFLAADGWKEYTVNFDTSGNYDAKIGFAFWDTENAKLAAGEANKDILILGMGLIGGGGQPNPTIPQAYKDIVLLGNADVGVADIEVLDPRDKALWDGKGASAWVKAGGASTLVTRQLSMYE